MQIDITPIEKTKLENIDGGCTFCHNDNLYITIKDGRAKYAENECYDIFAVNLATGELCVLNGDTEVIAKPTKIIDA